MRPKGRLRLGTSCLVLKAVLSAAEIEIEVEHTLSCGVRWAECGRERHCDSTQVALKEGECRLRPCSWKNNV